MLLRGLVFGNVKKCSLVTKGFEINTECLAFLQGLCLKMAVISHFFLTRTDLFKRPVSLFLLKTCCF